MKDDTRKLLNEVSTASLCTALFKRGLRNQFVQNVGPVAPGGPALAGGNMVGPAYTLRYIPAREDRNPITVFRDPEHLQRVAVERCPPGHVWVMDSRKDARAASAGSILVTRLMVRGCAGVVTDGGLRDAPGIGELTIPAFHQRPSAPTNLTLHEAIALDEPIACGDVAVFPGDVMVGDREGVVCVPVHLADELAQECAEMERFETFVTQEVLRGRAIIGLYPPTSEEAQRDYEASRKGSADDLT